MKICISTPFYGPQEAESSQSFAMTIAVLAGNGHEVCWDIEKMDSEKARARNVLLHRAYYDGFEYQLCIDKDHVWEPNEVLQLLEQKKDVIVPFAAMKKLPIEYVGNSLTKGFMPTEGPLVPMHSIGFGMVLISRACMAAMIEARKEHTFVAHSGASKGQTIAEVFTQGVVNGIYVADDAAFSARWRELGGKMWLHSQVNIGHVGNSIYR